MGNTNLNIQSKEVRCTRVILTGSFLCSIILAFVLASFRIRWAIVFLGLILISSILWFVIPYLHRQKKPIGWFLSIAVLNLLIVSPELALRLVDFRYQSVIEFGYPRSMLAYLESDEKLFWKRKSSDANVNSLGFQGEEIVIPKPQNSYRILYLGDSVTEQGYPGIVEHFLKLSYPDSPKNFESVVLAVSGYSSHQGRVLAETYGSQFEPDLVVVYFGWNDHWQAYGATDAKKVIKMSKTVWSRVMEFAYNRSRILQFLNWILLSHTSSDVTSIRQLRVPLNQYRDNLRQIEKVFTNKSVPAIFIMAPTSHYKLGVPDYLVEKNFVQDKKTAIRLHKEYNQVVRNIAQDGTSYSLDLEAEYNNLSAENLAALFLADGIHMTDIGLAVIAKRISEFIETHILSTVFLQYSVHKMKSYNQTTPETSRP